MIFARKNPSQDSSPCLRPSLREQTTRNVLAVILTTTLTFNLVSSVLIFWSSESRKLTGTFNASDFNSIQICLGSAALTLLAWLLLRRKLNSAIWLFLIGCSACTAGAIALLEPGAALMSAFFTVIPAVTAGLTLSFRPAFNFSLAHFLLWAPIMMMRYEIPLPYRITTLQFYVLVSALTLIASRTLQKFQELSDQSKLRSASEGSMNFLAQLSGAIAHEINNPLAAIKLKAALLEKLAAQNATVPSENVAKISKEMG